MIDKDDWIGLFTSAGDYSKQKISDPLGYINNFHWGSAQPVWNNNGGDAASIIKYSNVNSLTIPALK